MKPSEELAMLDKAFRDEIETQAQEERFHELMTLLDAAPELLEAVKSYLHDMHALQDATETNTVRRIAKQLNEHEAKLWAIIAKAEGRA